MTWSIWIVASAALGAYLGHRMLRGENRQLFMPGATTAGHYQIELDCGACHTAAFADRDSIQQACVDCHGAALRKSKDSHPLSKFTDPRNADRLAELDARYCVTCHIEHQPGRTQEMGLTLPEDYCWRCHQDIGEERPSHRELSFDSCASAGCHNYHDNRALYEDFLLQHATEPWLLDAPLVAERSAPTPGDAPLHAAEQDGPRASGETAGVIAQWAQSRHAQGGVNCSGCHGDSEDSWIRRPGIAACAECHATEQSGFLAGRHGMRLARGLPPMRPELARLTMRDAAHGRELSCTSCHRAHDFDTAVAAVDSCLDCHADEHSRAYLGSPHHLLWRAEQAGDSASGSGVSCATCHLPRETQRHADGQALVAAQHNQSANLRPAEQMARAVCMNCHGLGFVLDALADPRLLRNNFRGRPQTRVPGIEMALERERQRSRTAPERTSGADADEPAPPTRER